VTRVKHPEQERSMLVIQQRRTRARDRIVDAEVIKLELRQARLRAERRDEASDAKGGRPPARDRAAPRAR
jgi:hypothetical protein